MESTISGLTAQDIILSLAILPTYHISNGLRNAINDKLVQGEHDAKTLCKTRQDLETATSLIKAILEQHNENTASLVAAERWLHALEIAQEKECEF